jgi:hypothetical protein
MKAKTLVRLVQKTAAQLQLMRDAAEEGAGNMLDSWVDARARAEYAEWARWANENRKS